MLIEFDIAGAPAVFRRNWMTGRAELEVGENTIELQSIKDRSTHFEKRTERSWVRQIDGHEVEIVKVRPLFIAGFRSQQVTISVDGVEVASHRGF